MILVSFFPLFPRCLPPLVPGALRLPALHRGAHRGPARRRRRPSGAAPGTPWSDGSRGAGGAGAGDATAPGAGRSWDRWNNEKW